MPLPPLSPEQLVKPRHFEVRLALIFASLYVSLGINVPYFPLWLEAGGFGAEQIAVILAVPMFLRVVTTPLLTAYADRANDRVNVLLVLVGLSVVIACGYFLPPSYGVVLAVSLALSVVWTPHAPLADLLALSGVRRFGSNYTRMRIWGSIAFLRRQSRRRHRALLDRPAGRAGHDRGEPGGGLRWWCSSRRGSASRAAPRRFRRTTSRPRRNCSTGISCCSSRRPARSPPATD